MGINLKSLFGFNSSRRKDQKMGGDYEDKVQAAVPKSKIKGESPEDIEEGEDVLHISGIRFHKKLGLVHFHDDKAGLKCYVPVPVWWAAWEKLENPNPTNPYVFRYEDMDNKTVLTVETVLNNGAVTTRMSIDTFTPPDTFDRPWHALREFTRKTKIPR